MSRSLVESLERRTLLAVMTADFGALKPDGQLTKPGLGSLFAVTAAGNGNDRGLMDATTLLNSAPMDKAGETGVNPFSLAAIAPILDGTRAKTLVRFNDLMSGFPYDWPGLPAWNSAVDTATTRIKNSPLFKRVIKAVAPLNEPDWTLNGNDPTPQTPKLVNDPAVPGANYDAKIRWLWTHTVRRIRAIDASIPLMGPNWVAYYPHKSAADQTRMDLWMRDAKADNTIPQFMGWHQLYTGTAHDYGLALVEYRKLLAKHAFPNLPIINEEYGYNDRAYPGVPSALIQHWAEFEREGMDSAAAGVYDNGGALGNYYGNGWFDPVQNPNAGWHIAKWYMDMKGREAPVSGAHTRYANAYDGVASYDANSKTAKVLIGGPDDKATIALNNIRTLLGTNVRVKLEQVAWTVDDLAYEPNSDVIHGGDAVVAPVVLFDKVFAANASGHVNVDFQVQKYNGYLMTVTPSTATLSVKYEAEAATRVGGNVQSSAVASGGQYVGGLDAAGELVDFAVTAPANGLYQMSVGYAAALSGANTQNVLVNGVAQGGVSYAQTSGWLNTTVGTATKTVYLKAGANVVRMARASGAVELDQITLTPVGANGPVIHEAEDALNESTVLHLGTDATQVSGGGYIGGVDGAGDRVTFTVLAPAAGTYNLLVGYGAAASATQNLTVNGSAQAALALPGTGGWLSTKQGSVDRVVTLREGVNTVAFTHSSGFAELDYLAVSPTAARPAKYEAESAALVAANVIGGANGARSSNGAHVGGIDLANSSVTFTVVVPQTGLYDLTARYAAAGGNATHTVTVNGAAQGSINYPGTTGWMENNARLADKLVALTAGTNTIRLGKGTGFAELDFVDVQLDQHRYEAETAARQGGYGGHFPKAYTWEYHNHVGGLDLPAHGIDFKVEAPVAGTYRVDVAYGNGSGGASTHNVTVNGTPRGVASYQTTGGWLGSVGPILGQKVTTLNLSLNAGWNTVRLSKGAGYADLNWIDVFYTGAAARPGPTALPPAEPRGDAPATPFEHVSRDVLATRYDGVFAV